MKHKTKVIWNFLLPLELQLLMIRYLYFCTSISIALVNFMHSYKWNYLSNNIIDCESTLLLSILHSFRVLQTPFSWWILFLFLVLYISFSFKIAHNWVKKTKHFIWDSDGILRCWRCQTIDIKRGICFKQIL